MIQSGDNDNAEDINLNPESCEPLQILVFPPKNKKFLVDEETKFLKIEPIENSSSLREDEPEQLNKAGEDIASEEGNSFNCTVMEDTPNEINQSVNDDSNTNHFNFTHFHENRVKEMLKIDKPFMGVNCFLKGCKWSPDGLCLLSNSEDNILRLFEIPELTLNQNKDVLPVLAAKEGGIIYDFLWYPKMSSSDPVTCVFASTSHCSPIHLWDAYTGLLRATYQPINQYDEVTAAYSLAFSPDGCKIYAGFKKFVRIFDISQPGRISEERNLKPKGSSIFQTNITSSICVNPVMANIYAVGSYDKTIGIYTEPEGELQCLLKGHQGGVTQVMFSKNGVQLFSGGRKDSEIICWDLRNPGEILFTLKRKVNTNQRIHFDINDDGYLVTGSTDGNIIIYDTKEAKVGGATGMEPEMDWRGHDDCVNGVNFHPKNPVLASSSGQFHLPNLSINEEDCEDEINETNNVDNSLKLWHVDLIK